MERQDRYLRQMEAEQEQDTRRAQAAQDTPQITHYGGFMEFAQPLQPMPDRTPMDPPTLRRFYEEDLFRQVRPVPPEAFHLNEAFDECGGHCEKCERNPCLKKWREDRGMDVPRHTTLIGTFDAGTGEGE
jgi:hypothetical protein